MEIYFQENTIRGMSDTVFFHGYFNMWIVSQPLKQSTLPDIVSEYFFSKGYHFVTIFGQMFLPIFKNRIAHKSQTIILDFHGQITSCYFTTGSGSQSICYTGVFRYNSSGVQKLCHRVKRHEWVRRLQLTEVVLKGKG